MTIDHPLRPFLWVALIAFCIGFAGFIAVGAPPASASLDAAGLHPASELSAASGF
jgi:hypothetical protein